MSAIRRDVLVIIPAYNEAENIGGTILEIISCNIPADILVVNDGSADETAAVVAQYPVALVSHPFNMGYGSALQTGFKYAVQNGYQFVSQFDADGQHDPKDLLRIVEEIRKGPEEIIVGSRFLGRGTLKTGLHKRIVIYGFRAVIRCFTGFWVTDPTSGLKATSFPIFSYYAKMGQFPSDYPDADVLVESLRRHFRVREIAANMRPRSKGTSMHSGLKPLFYLMKICLSIFVVLMREWYFGKKGVAS